MSFLRIYKFSRSSYLLAIILIFPLVSCSGGDGGAGAGSSPSPSPTLSWVAPSERDDGSALSLSEIAGFRIYYGTEPGNYSGTISIDDHSATQAVFAGVPSGTYFTVLTTVDADGRESLYSREVVVEI